MSYFVLFYGELESMVENHKEVQIGENLVMKTVREWTKSHELRSSSFLNMFKQSCISRKVFLNSTGSWTRDL